MSTFPNYFNAKEYKKEDLLAAGGEAVSLMLHKSKGKNTRDPIRIQMIKWRNSYYTLLSSGLWIKAFREGSPHFHTTEERPIKLIQKNHARIPYSWLFPKFNVGGQ